MSATDGLDEVIFLFESDGVTIAGEMRHSEFEATLSGAAKLDEFAASKIKAIYAVVGNGLIVRGMVCFTISVDEDGMADPHFNVPLRYLVKNAGRGPDLGHGQVRLACRGQCPVPWHAVNLWEPEEESVLTAVQKTVWRNKLGLKPVMQTKVSNIDMVMTGTSHQHEAIEARINETFGEDGKVSLQQLICQHNDQLKSISTRYRTDLEQQQQAYLDQIRGCRDEIQRLKSALRNEQSRSRRLQQLLRGES